MCWPCASGTTPHKAAGIALLSEVSGVAVKLLLSAVHLCSYPNALKQVLFDFEDKLSYTTCLIIDWVQLMFHSHYLEMDSGLLYFPFFWLWLPWNADNLFYSAVFEWFLTLENRSLRQPHLTLLWPPPDLPSTSQKTIQKGKIKKS